MNPKAAATGKPAASTVDECVANCDAVLLSTYTACPATFVNVLLVAFSIATHCNMGEKVSRALPLSIHIFILF